MERLGLGGRLAHEGLVHSGVNLASENDLFHIDFAALTGRSITVYGQQEVMKDLFDAAEARGLDVVFEAADVTPHGIDGDAPFVSWRKDGADHRLDCDFVVGCDGFARRRARRHPAGRAHRLRAQLSVRLAGHAGRRRAGRAGADLLQPRARLRARQHALRHPQPLLRAVRPRRGAGSLAGRARFWDELTLRLGPAGAGVTRGAAIETTFAPLRNFVAEPMRFGRLFLAGDAAHIVPPTGAKGLNLAVSDVVLLAEALAEHYAEGSDAGLDAYSSRALARVWKAERFSWWLTRLTHSFPGDDPIERKLQLAELDYLATSQAAQTAFAENYVGLPLERR